MSDFQPKNILVTGGAGFIGANYIHYLLSQQATGRIVNLDLLTYAGNKDNLLGCDKDGRYQFIQGNICDKPLIEKILRQYEIDTIVHFAAESHVDRSITGPADFIQTNIVGTFTLLEAAKAYWQEKFQLDPAKCRFHHVSTDEVYGSLSLEDPAFTEKTPYAPNSPYSASKASSDHLVRAYQETYKLPTTLTNCSNNFGPFQHTEKFIPTVILACLHKRPIPIYGNGSNIRDWLFVEDHCKTIEAVIRKGKVGESYNVGGENELSNIDLAEKICELMDKAYPSEQSYKKLISYVTDRPGHDWRYAIDNSKLKQTNLYVALTPFDVAMEKTLTFYLKAHK